MSARRHLSTAAICLGAGRVDHPGKAARRSGPARRLPRIPEEARRPAHRQHPQASCAIRSLLFAGCAGASAWVGVAVAPLIPVAGTAACSRMSGAPLVNTSCRPPMRAHHRHHLAVGVEGDLPSRSGAVAGGALHPALDRQYLPWPPRWAPQGLPPRRPSGPSAPFREAFERALLQTAAISKRLISASVARSAFAPTVRPSSKKRVRAAPARSRSPPVGGAPPAGRSSGFR